MKPRNDPSYVVEVEQKQIIPTRYKSKLSSTLSWPIGAEELSAALKDVPQFAELESTFYFRGAKDIAQAETTAWMTLLKIADARCANLIQKTLWRSSFWVFIGK
jgi:hypothetical protein